jgi:hypothetical protein
MYKINNKNDFSLLLIFLLMLLSPSVCVNLEEKILRRVAIMSVMESEILGG